MDELRDDTDYVYIRNESMPTFKEMWNRDDLSDVQLCCDSKKFNVHRFLLAACSPYFQSLFQRNSCENLNVEIDNVKCVDLQHVLTYMYEGSVRVKNDDLQGFGELLEMFLMPLPVDMVVSTENSETDVESIEKIDGIKIATSYLLFYAIHFIFNFSSKIPQNTVLIISLQMFRRSFLS